MAPTLVEHVVADAGAFLKRAPLQVRTRDPRTGERVCRYLGDAARPECGCGGWGGIGVSGSEALICDPGDRSEHLHAAGCGGRDPGQRDPEEPGRAAVPAALQGAASGARQTR